jgi:hypothetical protein
MQPNDDRTQLKAMLQEWQVPGPPASLEQRVLRACRPGYRPPYRIDWRSLFTGYIRVPVFLVYALAVLLTATIWRVSAYVPATRPCVAAAHSVQEGPPRATPIPVRCDHPLPGVC